MAFASIIHAMSIEINPITQVNHAWVMQFLEAVAHSLQVVSRGVLHEPGNLPGFIGQHDGKPVALLTYVYPNTLTHSRTLKPEIPLIGNGIPIRDEIEFEIRLSNC